MTRQCSIAARRHPVASGSPRSSASVAKPGPRVHDLSDIAPGEWFARPDPRVLRRLAPDVRMVRIEVNGHLAGASECLAEASREFAIGWAFMHRFFSDPADLGTVSGSSGRVAIMLDSGEDLDRLRRIAAGWESPDDDGDAGTAASSRPPRTVPFVSQDDAISVAERTFARFDVDGRNSGLACAALAQGDVLVVIARDICTRGAVAKILGWRMAGDADVSDSILIVSGLVDDLVVEGASRAGIGAVITDAEPTAAAIRRANMLGTTILGLVMSHRRSFFADGGHVGDDADQEPQLDCDSTANSLV